MERTKCIQLYYIAIIVYYICIQVHMGYSCVFYPYFYISVVIYYSRKFTEAIIIVYQYSPFYYIHFTIYNVVIKVISDYIYSGIYYITSRQVHTIPFHIPAVLLIIGAFAQYTLFLYLNMKREIYTI
jgi:hypothetical protein